MKKIIFILITTVVFSACTNSNREHRDNASTDSTLPLLDTTNKAQTYTADVNLNGDEKVFLLNSSLTAQRIVEFTHLASQRATDLNLRKQAKNIESEYGKMLTDLQAIAKGKGIELSTNQPAEELQTLQNEPSANFDQLYVQLILKAHANLIQQLNMGEKLPNQAIKNFSSNSLIVANKNNSDFAKILK